MTATTRRRITIAAKVVRAIALALALVVLSAIAALAAVNYLIPREKAADQRRTLRTLRKAWADLTGTATALTQW